MAMHIPEKLKGRWYWLQNQLLSLLKSIYFLSAAQYLGKDRWVAFFCEVDGHRNAMQCLSADKLQDLKVLMVFLFLFFFKKEIANLFGVFMPH